MNAHEYITVRDMHTYVNIYYRCAYYCLSLPHKHVKSVDYIIIIVGIIIYLYYIMIIQLHNYYMHRKIAIYVLVILFLYNSYSKLLVPINTILYYTIVYRSPFSIHKNPSTLYWHSTAICAMYHAIF